MNKKTATLIRKTIAKMYSHTDDKRIRKEYQQAKKDWNSLPWNKRELERKVLIKLSKSENPMELIKKLQEQK